uniref:Uncharacterized protein n=1 Tax=Glossina palpalis gambiensis TaxID=67801 RepID=A0A1B0ASP8_9MUSC
MEVPFARRTLCVIQGDVRMQRTEDCLIRIHKLLRARKLDHAIALMRAASSLLQCSPSYGLWLKREDKKYILQLCDTHRKNSGAGSSSDIRKSNPVRL